MMEMAQGTSQGAEDNAASGLTPPASQAQSAPVQTPTERTFRQQEVNDIVKRAKNDAVETYRRLQVEQPQYFAQKYGEMPQQPQQQSQQNQQFSANTHNDEVRRIAAEEAAKLRDAWVQEQQTKSQNDAAQRTVQNFWGKINPGREKYQDFDKVTGDIDLRRFPNVVQLLGDYLDNSADVLYDLGKNRMKLSQLEQLAYMSPNDAVVEAQRLAQSLKDNETASKMQMPNAPLSQMRPSNTGTDNGVLGVKDLRRKYKV